MQGKAVIASAALIDMSNLSAVHLEWTSIRRFGPPEPWLPCSCARQTSVCATPLRLRSACLGTLQSHLLIGQWCQMTLSFVPRTVEGCNTSGVPAAASQPTAHMLRGRISRLDPYIDVISGGTLISTWAMFRQSGVPEDALYHCGSRYMY
jgi:hypothetical protein